MTQGEEATSKKMSGNGSTALEEEQPELVERGEKIELVTSTSTPKKKGNGQCGLSSSRSMMFAVMCVLSCCVLIFAAVRTFARNEQGQPSTILVETPSTSAPTTVQNRGYDWYKKVCPTISSEEEAAELGVEIQYPGSYPWFDHIGPLQLTVAGSDQWGWLCYAVIDYCYEDEDCQIDELCNVFRESQSSIDWSNATYADLKQFENTTFPFGSCCQSCYVLDELLVESYFDFDTVDVWAWLQDYSGTNCGGTPP